MPIVTSLEAAECINKDTPYGDNLRFFLMKNQDDPEWVFGKTGPDLIDVINHMLDRRRLPVVDQRSRLVFGIAPTMHRDMCSILYCYHQNGAEKWGADDEGRCRQQDLYVDTGLGYYISSVMTHRVVVNRNYRPDPWDDVVFARFKAVPMSI